MGLIGKILGAAALTAVAFVGGAQAQPFNQPPPLGAILDLNGGVIPHGTPQQYMVNFTASLANTDITMAFREDPAFVFVGNISVTDVTTSSGNLLVNGDFGTGSLAPWIYANVYGATYGGFVTTSCEGYFSDCWYDGAVQAYDAIDQTIATTPGDVYQVSFWATDNGGLTNWSDLSTNGNITDTGGNGADILVYAEAGLPPPGTVPEPSTWVMLILGFGGLGLAGYRRARVASAV